MSFLLIALSIMCKNLSNVYYRKKDSHFNLYFESSLARAHKCDLKKWQLIFGFLISILSGSSSLRTEQPKQLPSSKHIFCKKPSSLRLTLSISKGIWPIIYPLWQGYGNMNSCSQVKLGTDVPALKPLLVLNNLWWDLNLRSFTFQLRQCRNTNMIGFAGSADGQELSYHQPCSHSLRHCTESLVPQADKSYISKERKLQIGRRITVSREGGKKLTSALSWKPTGFSGSWGLSENPAQMFPLQVCLLI